MLSLIAQIATVFFFLLPLQLPAAAAGEAPFVVVDSGGTIPSDQAVPGSGLPQPGLSFSPAQVGLNFSGCNRTETISLTSYPGLKPGLERLPASDEGYIVYTVFDQNLVEIAGQKHPVPCSRLQIMTPDGKSTQTFIDPGRFRRAAQAWWSRDGRYLAFVSDFEMEKSAFFTDIFKADLAQKKVFRLTGNDQPPQGDQGTGTIFGMIMEGSCSIPGSMATVAISCQGLDGAIHHTSGRVKINQPGAENAAQDAGEAEKGFVSGLESAREKLTGFENPERYGHNYTITGVPAGLVWVKCWVSPHLGDLKQVTVPAGGEAQVEPFDLVAGNRMVSHPSLSPDGRRLACLSEHAFTLPPTGSNGRLQQNAGFDTVALADIKTPGAKPWLWNPREMNGDYSRDPKLSPDGKWLALARGDYGRESLVVISTASLRLGQPEVRELVAGELHLGSHTIGNVQPAWSPDGRFLSFTRYRMTTSELQGNLCKVPFSGGDFQKLTDLKPNQLSASSSWSPDGRSLALQVITSYDSRLRPEDLVLRKFTSNLYRVSSEGKLLKQLTIDGQSGEPAWGRLPLGSSK